VWVALPRDVNRWWRQRDRMVLTQKGENWSVEGEGSERARVAFATLQVDRLVYSFADPQVNAMPVTREFSRWESLEPETHNGSF